MAKLLANETEPLAPPPPPLAPGENGIDDAVEEIFGKDNAVSDSALRASATFSACIFAGLIVLFTLAQSRSILYKFRLVSPSVSYKPPPLPTKCVSALWAWLVSTMTTSDEELLASCGLDALMMVKFSTFGVQLFAPWIVVALGVLMPIHYVAGGYLDDPTNKNKSASLLSRFTTTNIEPGSPVLWVHCVLVLLLNVYTCWLLKWHYRQFMVLRQHYMKNGDDVAAWKQLYKADHMQMPQRTLLSEIRMHLKTNNHNQTAAKGVAGLLMRPRAQTSPLTIAGVDHGQAVRGDSGSSSAVAQGQLKARRRRHTVDVVGASNGTAPAALPPSHSRHGDGACSPRASAHDKEGGPAEAPHVLARGPGGVPLSRLSRRSGHDHHHHTGHADRTCPQDALPPRPVLTRSSANPGPAPAGSAPKLVRASLGATVLQPPAGPPHRHRASVGGHTRPSPVNGTANAGISPRERPSPSRRRSTTNDAGCGQHDRHSNGHRGRTSNHRGAAGRLTEPLPGLEGAAETSEEQRAAEGDQLARWLDEELTARHSLLTGLVDAGKRLLSRKSQTPASDQGAPPQAVVVCQGSPAALHTPPLPAYPQPAGDKGMAVAQEGQQAADSHANLLYAGNPSPGLSDVDVHAQCTAPEPASGPPPAVKPLEALEILADTRATGHAEPAAVASMAAPATPAQMSLELAKSGAAGTDRRSRGSGLVSAFARPWRINAGPASAQNVTDEGSVLPATPMSATAASAAMTAAGVAVGGKAGGTMSRLRGQQSSGGGSVHGSESDTRASRQAGEGGRWRGLKGRLSGARSGDLEEGQNNPEEELSDGEDMEGMDLPRWYSNIKYSYDAHSAKAAHSMQTLGRHRRNPSAGATSSFAPASRTSSSVHSFVASPVSRNAPQAAGKQGEADLQHLRLKSPPPGLRGAARAKGQGLDDGPTSPTRASVAGGAPEGGEDGRLTPTLECSNGDEGGSPDAKQSEGDVAGGQGALLREQSSVHESVKRSDTMRHSLRRSAHSFNPQTDDFKPLAQLSIRYKRAIAVADDDGSPRTANASQFAVLVTDVNQRALVPHEGFWEYDGRDSVSATLIRWFVPTFLRPWIFYSYGTERADGAVDEEEEDYSECSSYESEPYWNDQEDIESSEVEDEGTAEDAQASVEEVAGSVEEVAGSKTHGSTEGVPEGPARPGAASGLSSSSCTTALPLPPVLESSLPCNAGVQLPPVQEASPALTTQRSAARTSSGRSIMPVGGHGAPPPWPAPNGAPMAGKQGVAQAGAARTGGGPVGEGLEDALQEPPNEACLPAKGCEDSGDAQPPPKDPKALWALLSKAVLVDKAHEAMLEDPVKFSLVTATFKRMFPDDFDAAIPVIRHFEVDQLMRQVDLHLGQYEKARAYQQKMGKRPRGKLGFCGLFGEEVDLLKFHKEKIRDLQPKIKEARKKALKSGHTPSWFVFFKSQYAAAVARQCVLHGEDHREFTVTVAPGPEEVNWQALWFSYRQRAFRQWFTRPLLLLLVLIPVGLFSGGLMQIENVLCPSRSCQSLTDPTDVLKLQKACPEGYKTLNEPDFTWDWYCEQDNFISKNLSKLLIGWLPSLLLALWQGLGLPILVYLLVQASGTCFSLSSLDLEIANYMWYFASINVFLGGVLGSAVVQQINNLVKSGPFEVLELIGSYLPSSSNFFISFIMLRALVTLPLRLFIPHAGVRFFIFRRWLRFTRTPLTEREKAFLYAPTSPRYGIDLGNLCGIFLISLAFAVVSPLVSVVSVAFFIMSWILWRYTLLYVYVRKYESGGLQWLFMFRRILMSIAIATIFNALVLLVKEAYIQGVLLLLVVPFMLYRFANHCFFRFGINIHHLPLEYARDAPRGSIDPRIYIPPPLNPIGHSWNPEWPKVWQGWNLPPYCAPGKPLE